MCAKFGCGPRVVSKKGGGVQTERQTKKTAALYSRLAGYLASLGRKDWGREGGLGEIGGGREEWRMEGREEGGGGLEGGMKEGREGLHPARRAKYH